jgi:hypothetical protein
MDDGRVTGIGQGLAKTIEGHAKLASCTNDPVFLQLIELAKRYFVLLHAQGLMEESTPGDIDMEFASYDAVGAIEAEIIELAGREGFERFEEWATKQEVDWEPPHHLKDNELYRPTLRLV